MAITYKIVKPDSELLQSVIALGDTARVTIGFLPHEAFTDYAIRQHILAAVGDDKLYGYVMFSKKEHIITLVQLCVAEEYRNHGVAKGLVDELLRLFQPTVSGISLFCRRDYGLEGFWRKLGFSPIDEKRGRVKNKETILTRWFRRDPNCPDMLSQLFEQSKQKRVVLNTNIVIALSEGKDEETACLLNPLVQDAVDFYITKEVLSEINKKDDDRIRNSHRSFAREHFETLENFDESTYQGVLADLLRWKSIIQDSNSEIDASHIAYSIAAGVYAFITKDETWLKETVVDYIFKKYGLIVESPGQLIRSIDELYSPNDYVPIRLAGLEFQYSSMSSNDFGKVVECFYSQYKEGKKNIFDHDLRDWMASTDKYAIQLVKDAQGIVALIVSLIDDNSLDILYLFINQKRINQSIYSTFIIRLAFRALEEAREKRLNRVRIAINGIVDDSIPPFLECGYSVNDEWLYRKVVDKIIEKDELKTLIAGDRIVTSIENNGVYTDIEKMLWPCKIRDTGVLCYIVPIKPGYAMELFDEHLKNLNNNIFANDKPLPALSNENVYFKKKKNSIKKYPARILWYVSHNTKYCGTGSIRACSYLDLVEVGTIAELFRKYRRIGVLEWDKMLKYGKPEEDITAYRFSYTEQLQQPVSLRSVRDTLGREDVTFQSYLEIDESQFLSIYRQGFGNG